jgi:four helix bundle protein
MYSQNFEDVELWKKAHAWVLAIYKFTENFPKQEIFGLTSQLRRSAISVPANFAEGFRKLGLADKVRFYNISQGSLEESRYYLMLAKDLQFGDSTKLLADATEISRMLGSYIRTIQNKNRK